MHKNLSIKELAVAIGLIAVIVGSTFYLGWKLGYQGETLGIFGRNNAGGDELKRAYAIIDQNWFGEFNRQEAVDAALVGLVESLHDSRSQYYPADQYQLVQAAAEDRFRGVGAIFTRVDGKLRVIEVIDGTTAAREGIVPGDSIVTISGQDVGELDRLAIGRYLGATPGTQVVLTIEHQEQQREVELEISEYEIPDLVFTVRADGIGYLKTYQFSSDYRDRIDTIADEIRSSGTQKLVIDMRNNLGGNSGAGVYLADKFISEGILVQEQKSKGQDIKSVDANGAASLAEIEVVILANEYTASEAEVFVAAIHDNERARTVGMTTLGKGTEQSYFDLSDGSGLKITTGRWYTPKGVWIDGVGIIPDVEVPRDWSVRDDTQLLRALEMLGEN
jgi:carboxyl-terminal processing protease